MSLWLRINYLVFTIILEKCGIWHYTFDHSQWRCYGCSCVAAAVTARVRLRPDTQCAASRRRADSRGVFRGGTRGPRPTAPQSPIPKKFLSCLSSLIQERIHQNCTAIAPKLLKLYCSVDISAAFCPLSCIHCIYIYRKTSVRSRAPGRRRAPHTGRGGGLIHLYR